MNMRINIKRFIIAILLVIFVMLPFAADGAVKKKSKKTVRTIEIQTKDEVILTGTLSIPEKATVKSKVPLVVLLHSLGSNKSIYNQLAEDLKALNIATLALDSRGHSQSTTKLSGKRTYWQNYSNTIFAKYPDDINEAIDFVKEHYVAIDTGKIGLLGADITANAAILVATKAKYNFKTLVLISPSMNFKGLRTPTALVKYGNKPITIIVTQTDKYHYNNARELEKYAQGQVNFITTKIGGTGDSIIKLNPYLNKVIANWFAKYL